MKKKLFLSIYRLCASLEGKQILKDISLTIRSGETHAIMGPNGSGKSTLANVIMGNLSYHIDNKISHIIIGSKDITNFATDERARAGLFLAFQSPMAIPGVSVPNLLRTSYQSMHLEGDKNTKSIQNTAFASAWRSNGMTLPQFTSRIKEYAKFLHVDDSFLSRGINDGFSGGEKKKIEMLQALVLEPKFAIFDEIDTGLDVDALKVVASGISRLAKLGTGVLVITHYQRILKYLEPDMVHILVNGKIVKSGSARLAREIEQKGYQTYANATTR